jgi:hypothetical protein
MTHDDAIKYASKKLRKLRLTDVTGRKEHPADTVKSVLMRGLGGLYDDASIEYILRYGIKYYHEAVRTSCK